MRTTVLSHCSRAFEGGLPRRVGRERGLTLVELMVAMAIGLFLVLIATTIYVRGLSNVSFRMGQSENLNNSRYTLSALDSEFSKAGYRRDPTQSLVNAFPADAAAHANGCLFTEGQAMYAPDATTLCIRFQARDKEEKDCVGTAATGLDGIGAYMPPDKSAGADAGVFVEKYSVQSGKLICQAGTELKTTEIADGVRGLHFEFGVDTQTDPTAPRRVVQYQNTAPVAGEVIRALRYAVLLSSTAKGLTQGMASTVCERWAEAGGAAESCVAKGGALYQLATGSITLRNLMP